jgi:predicted phosphodiesterase
MKIAIINDVHIGPKLEYGGSVRASSHMAEEALVRTIEHIAKNHSPDLLVNLGDLIRSQNLESDIKRYKSGIHCFHSSKSPVLHMIGNHEIKCMSPDQVMQIWKEAGINQKSYGTMSLGPLRLVWVGLTMDPSNKKLHYLPQDQMEWLRSTLSNTKAPTLLFSHCALDAQNLKGNFFYETFEAGDSSGFFLRNQDAVRKILGESGCVKAVIQAHLHHFYSKTNEGITYITCPALADNICGPNIPNNVPEIYTLITIENEKLIVKAYSREYSFAGTEVPINL